MFLRNENLSNALSVKFFKKWIVGQRIISELKSKIGTLQFWHLACSFDQTAMLCFMCISCLQLAYFLHCIEASSEQILCSPHSSLYLQHWIV